MSIADMISMDVHCWSHLYGLMIIMVLEFLPNLCNIPILWYLITKEPLKLGSLGEVCTDLIWWVEGYWGLEYSTHTLLDINPSWQCGTTSSKVVCFHKDSVIKQSGWIGPMRSHPGLWLWPSKSWRRFGCDPFDNLIKASLSCGENARNLGVLY